MDQIKSIIENFNEPILFNGFINDWEVVKWSLNDWESKLDGQFLEFRRNKFIKTKDPIWEKSCLKNHMHMKEFIEFQSKENNDSWVYFDYKYMDAFFEERTQLLEAIEWGKFGYPEKTGKDSTIWIGSKGAHTPCHQDTYGCNLIGQIYGRKRWIIFPPEENLLPTRVPFEESSIYSKLNFFYPDLNHFKGVGNARTLILNPGDALFLPAGWWHYVENLETAISINMWIPQPQDERKRVEETITQLLVSQILKQSDKNVQSAILNPNNSFILEDSVPEYISFLETVTERCKNKKQKNETASSSSLSSPSELPDIMCFMKENHINVVPKLSQMEFMNLLKEQTMKYNFIKDGGNSKEISTESTSIEKLINAMCHPEVLTMITDKFLNQ